MQELLRLGEERFRQMADHAPVLIWIMDANKLCTWFNKPWLNFVGRPMEKELGNGWAENVHPDDLSLCLQVFEQQFDLRQPFMMHYRLRRHDGEYRWIHDTGSPLFEVSGMFTGYIGSCLDITEARQTEEALRISEQKMRKLLETTGVIPWAARSGTGVFTYVGRQAAQILGYPLDQWYEQDFLASHLHPEDRDHVLEFYRISADSCTDFEFEFRMVSSEGRVVWFHDLVSCEVVGGVKELRGFMTDVTSRKQSETVLRRSRQELQELSAMLLTAADDEARRIARELHDNYGQRLAKLNLDAFELQRQLSSRPDLADKIEEILQGIREIAEATHDLSHRQHPAILSQLGLVAALESECTSFTKQNGIEVNLSVEGEPAKTSDAVSLCLYRVAQESLHNTKKYSQAKDVAVALQFRRGEIILSIRDSGRGFDPAAVRGRGGLGLVSMEERVRLVKGIIAIQSKPSEGTHVVVRIPTVEDQNPRR